MATVAPPQTPLTAHWATWMWLLAVGAGVAESVVGAVVAVGDGISMPALAAQLAVRTLVYGGLFVTIDRFFRRGVAWSRYLLAGLLGTVGLASLVYQPVSWLAENDLTQLDWSASFLISATLRTIHLSALLAALILTFHPDTNRWFHR
ncbi:hypothetical protein ACGFIF_43875 [Kribbella sp. NPDC049174]|uniref:hypothetical protein n=1 Tax=Kribbella sp. NPDC049174 TaxID=3364112 RepID=UPI00370F8B67